MVIEDIDFNTRFQGKLSASFATANGLRVKERDIRTAAKERDIRMAALRATSRGRTVPAGTPYLPSATGHIGGVHATSSYYVGPYACYVPAPKAKSPSKVKPSYNYEAKLEGREYSGSEKERRAEERRAEMAKRSQRIGGQTGALLGLLGDSPASGSSSPEAAAVSKEEPPATAATVESDLPRSSRQEPPANVATAESDLRRAKAAPSRRPERLLPEVPHSISPCAVPPALVGSIGYLVEADVVPLEFLNDPSGDERDAQAEGLRMSPDYAEKVASRIHTAEEKARRAEARGREKWWRQRQDARYQKVLAGSAVVQSEPFSHEEPAAEPAAEQQTQEPAEEPEAAEPAAEPSTTNVQEVASPATGYESAAWEESWHVRPTLSAAVSPVTSVPAVPRSWEKADPTFARVIHAFDGTGYGEDYLVLNLGQSVRFLHQSEEDGWLYGQLLATGKKGWYPPGYLDA
eukprot:gnl/TRDRNA2_/TRDRNA2_43587_c0_seq1.p1 gnl/TRDRNA2_/TRDRNA2_43587_c0~~gnl/TRDRNA2_/TRDRNA2_43587_c0_seq1.p1  ORF type:complete len:462 (+),score=82.78 gnl/TRDRNA2_/TRDRNA2_43587_c0_seq1:63-1448(+)